MNQYFKISKHYQVLLGFILLLAINFFAFENSTNYWLVNTILIVSLIIILYIGVTRHRLNYFYDSINSGSKPGLSLTFDDGPNPEFTESILAILKKKKVKASFFIIGKNIEGNESLLNKIYTNGHIIANHSMNHTYWFNVLPGSKIAEEIIATENKINEVIGVKPNFYRTPFGLTSPNVARGIKKVPVQSIGWDFRSFDTMATDEKALLSKLKKNAHKSSIILLHDNNQFTLAVLEAFINYCLTNGIKIVPLDEMIGIKAYK